MSKVDVGWGVLMLLALLACKKSESEAASGTCAKAMACCKAMTAKSGSAEGVAACDAYAKQTEATCAPALAQFQQSAKALGIDCGGTGAPASTATAAASAEPTPSAKPDKPATRPAVANAKPGKPCQSQADCPGLSCCWTTNGVVCAKGCSEGRICTSDGQCPKGTRCEFIGLGELRACGERPKSEPEPKSESEAKSCPAGQKAVKGPTGDIDCMTPCDPSKTFCGNGPMRCEPYGPDKVPVCL